MKRLVPEFISWKRLIVACYSLTHYIIVKNGTIIFINVNSKLPIIFTKLFLEALNNTILPIQNIVLKVWMYFKAHIHSNEKIVGFDRV
jgi:hypothetical protein